MKRMEFHEMIFIALFASLNVGLSLVLSPPLKQLFTHIIAGVVFMVPLNFILMWISKRIVPKFGSLTLYLGIYGLLSWATPLFGAVAGYYKIVIGAALGLAFDAIYMALEKQKQGLLIGIFSIGGAFVWWLITFTIWSAFGFPFVRAFSGLYNSVIPISSIITVPVVDFTSDWFIFTIICGLTSAIPVLIAVVVSEFIARRIMKTALYTKFTNFSFGSVDEKNENNKN
jgi:hypothetical protein